MNFRKDVDNGVKDRHLRHLIEAMLRRSLVGEAPREVPKRLQALVSFRARKIAIEGNLLSFSDHGVGKAGVFVSKMPLTPSNNYFEVEVVDTGKKGAIAIGLAHKNHSLDCLPGWVSDSVAYHLDDGMIFESNIRGRPFGPKCEVGDRVGCGVKFDQRMDDVDGKRKVPVFFTRNGKEIGFVLAPLRPETLNPAIGMHSEGESICFMEDVVWRGHEVIQMAVDNHEDEWAHLHDITINGQTLEYVGLGKSIVDVGLAQAKQPLNTRHHYFEIEITDPGENCYIAIGLTRKDYPKHRHPGWDKGSIAYHADDGKIFVGSGVGEQFGPKCQKGDVMGCGILFPRNFTWEDEGLNSDDDLSGDEERPPKDCIDFELHDLGLNLDDEYDEDEENFIGRKFFRDSNTKVQVFFTRNGSTVGRREIPIPEGGFFPTVGMLSCFEKVIVDLKPMTG